MKLSKDATFEDIILAVKNLNDESLSKDLKTKLVNYLNSTGVTATPTESFENLVNKLNSDMTVEKIIMNSIF